MLRLAVLGLTLIALAAGCSQGKIDEKMDGPRIGFGVTTSAATGTTLAPIAAPATLDDAAARALVEQFNVYGNSAVTNPRDGVLEAFIDPSCPCYQEAKAKLDELIAEEWYFASSPFVITNVSIREVPFENYVVLQISSEILETEILNSEGLVVDVQPAIHEDAVTTLAYANGRWRIVDDLSTQTPVPTTVLPVLPPDVPVPTDAPL